MAWYDDAWNGAKTAFGYTPVGAAYNYMDPSKGPTTAAQGAKNAQGQYQNLADTQWNQQMQGLGQANSYFQPYQGYLTNMQARPPGAFDQGLSTWNAQLAGPGSFGNWYNQNQSQLQGPSQSSTIFGQMQDQMGPSSTENLYNNTRWNPTQSSGAYANLSQQLGGPGASEGAFANFGQRFTQPGAMQDFYNQNKNAFSNGTSSQRLYENNYGGYGDQGYTENLARYQNSQNKLDQLFASQNAMKDALGQQSRTEAAAPELSSLYHEGGNLGRTANQAEAYAQRQLPGVERQGTGEQFFQSAMQGNNPYLQRIEDQNMAKLNQQLAARGHYNSGGAGAAIGNLLAASEAEKFKVLQDSANQAQQLGMQRIGLGQGLAQSSDTGRLNRGQAVMGEGGALQGLAGQTENERMARNAMTNDLNNSMAAQLNANRQFDLAAGQAADQMKLARLQGMGNLAGQADSTGLAGMNYLANLAQGASGENLAGLNSYFNAANNRDQAMNNRLGLMMNSAGQTDSANLANLMAQFNTAGMSDQQKLARMGMLLNGAGQADSTMLARLGLGGQLAGQNDQNMLARIMAQANLAGQSQNFGMQQDQQMLDNLFRVANAQSGNTMGAYGLGSQLYGNAMDSGINAGMTAAMLQAQAQGARQEQFMKFLSYLQNNASQGMGMYTGGV